jgi:hypothetical protein
MGGACCTHGGDDKCRKKTLDRRSEGMRTIGRRGHIQGNNIKTDLMEIGLNGVDWICMVWFLCRW